MHRRTVLTASGTVATALLAGCAGYLTDDDDGIDGTETSTPKPTALELVEHNIVRQNEGTESEIVTVAGTAKNGSDEVISDATVAVTFYDEEQTVLGESTAEIRELQPGNKWTFGVLYSEVGEEARAVTDYEIVDETEYPSTE